MGTRSPRLGGCQSRATMPWKWITKGLAAVKVWRGALESLACLPMPQFPQLGEGAESWLPHVSSSIGQGCGLGRCCGWMG